MIVLLLLHLVVGIGLLSASRWLTSGGRQDVAFVIAAVPSAATVCWLAVVAPGVIDGDARSSHVSWIPSLGVDLDLRLDGVRGPDAGARRWHRRARDRLCLALLHPSRAARRAPPRPARAVRRSDGRPRRRRQPPHPVRLLGADVGDVVPADRQPPRGRPGAVGGAAGAPRDRTRRAGDARRLHRHRPGGRDVPPERTARRSSGRHDGNGRPAADPARCLHEVGPGPVPHLAAGRDGGPDTRQHVPALGDDGEGGRLPRRPVRPRLRPHHRVVATGRRERRGGDDDRRWRARPAPHRPQAAARRRHDQPARVHDRRVRLGHDGDHRRRLHDVARPRCVQGDGLHGRRCPRPRARHARHPPPAPPRGRVDADRRGGRGGRGVDGGCPVALRLRRQGSRLHRLPRAGRRRRHGAGGHRRRLGADGGL